MSEERAWLSANAALDAASEEQPTPEQLASLPLQTASMLLPEEETPPPPSASEPPPAGEVYGPFIVQTVRGYGEGFRVLVLDDEIYQPVGVWLLDKHPHASGQGVHVLLTQMGLPDRYAESFARQRDNIVTEVEIPPDIAEIWRTPRDRATAVQMINAWGVDRFRTSSLHQAALREREHGEIKESFSRAFIERQQREGKRK